MKPDENSIAIICLCILCAGVIYLRVDPLYSMVNTVAGGVLGYMFKTVKG